MKSINHSDPRLPTGTNHCRCTACGLYFGGVNGFDLHRTGPAQDRACLAPGDMRDKHNRPVFRFNNLGYWIRAYGDRPQKLAAVA